MNYNVVVLVGEGVVGLVTPSSHSSARLREFATMEDSKSLRRQPSSNPFEVVDQPYLHFVVETKGARERDRTVRTTSF
jgi:hypothetical protein